MKEFIGALPTGRDSYQVPDWINGLARDSVKGDKYGRLARVDASARVRAAAEIHSGNCISLSRELTDEGPAGGFHIETEIRDHGEVVTAGDVITSSCHGASYTHIDGINHFGAHGSWFGEHPAICAVESSSPSIADWARHGIVTRAWFFDVTRFRGVEWIAESSPVEGEELAAIADQSGMDILSGDAILIYMGRDRFEKAGHHYLSAAASHLGRSGLGPSAGAWLSETPASVLCWDFMDACGDSIGSFGVHLLIWAIGLVLVDNCDLSGARQAMEREGRHSGCLVISPLRIVGATGCLVNPLLLT